MQLASLMLYLIVGRSRPDMGAPLRKWHASIIISEDLSEAQLKESDDLKSMELSLRSSAGATDQIFAVTNGWILPLWGIMHCEALQIFTKGMRGEKGARVREGALGLGLLLGAATFAYGRRRGCKKAEILAIKDDGAPQACACILWASVAQLSSCFEWCRLTMSPHRPWH
jgi:hypothetical protein